MKTTCISVLMIMLCTLINVAYAQLRIDPYGNIGMGMDPSQNSIYKCNIKGNLLLTTYPEIPPSMSNYVEFTFKVGNGWPGTEFGSNFGKVALYNSSFPGYNTFYCEKVISVSDSN